MNRREFFRSLGRYTVLGTIAAVGALVGGRRGIDRAKQRCVNKSVCGNCPTYDECRLPAALTAKQEGEPSETEQRLGETPRPTWEGLTCSDCVLGRASPPGEP